MFLFCKNRNDVVEADDLIIKEEKFISAATREHCAKTFPMSPCLREKLYWFFPFV